MSFKSSAAPAPAPVSAPVVVTLAGQSYELKVPASFLPREALDSEIHRVFTSNEERDDPIFGRIVWSAFVGAYIPDLLPHGLSLKAHRWQVASFGEAVYDHLRALGCTTSEIVDVGLDAAKLNRDSLAPREHEVSEVAGNS